jgi:hypothetical protein
MQCPDASCKYTAGYVQSLRYHYLRTHGDQLKFQVPLGYEAFSY